MSRYALPANVLAEPPGRGTITTTQLRRRTIGTLPRDASYSSGYAVPRYIEDEELGRGAAVTHQLPRGWPGPALGNYLGSDEPGDPLDDYGHRVANWITATIGGVPASKRPYALRAALDQVEPCLYNKVVGLAKKFHRAGMPAAEASKEAIASALREGAAKEMVRLGRRSPAALDGVWDSIKDAASKTKSWLSKPENAIAALNPLALQAKLASSDKAQEWAGKAAKEIGNAACAVASSPLAPAAAGAAGAAYGAPPQAGAAGASVAAQVCAGEQPPAPPPSQTGTPSWVLPVAIGGAGLVAVLLLTR